MSYKDYINNLSAQISTNIVNLEAKRKRGKPPTQAFSNFLTNREQGEWAEALFFDCLKEADIKHIPVRYGKSDQIIAGDPEFKDFYNKYQDELDTMGKRPDILLLGPEIYKPEWGEDISKLPLSNLKNIIEKSIAGFEVRSSAYLTKKFRPKKDRPFLSFTPKVEDLLVVMKWINTFDVPHYYVQVFFDAIYIIPLSEILSILKDAQIKERGKKNRKIFGYIEGELAFQIEKNPKNQYKETIHLFINRGHLLSDSISQPHLIGSRKELSGGRLLHYISFEGGKSKIKEEVLLRLIENPVK